MKWPIVFLMFSGHGIAQQGDAVPDLVSLPPPIETRINERMTIQHYLSGGELIALRCLEKGELANEIQTTWYFKGDNIQQAIRKECRTDDAQILDLAMYNESHRDSDGKVNYEDLPTNCVSVTVDFSQPKMTRTIEGTDIFPPLKEYAIEKEALHQRYLELVNDLSSSN